MKKIIALFLGILFFTGCSFTDMMNTPTKRVEEFLGKYQTMDSEVLEQLSDVISRNASLTDKLYLENHEDEFTTDNKFDDEKFMDYKIKEMQAVKDKVKYTLNFTLTKENDKWKLGDITDSMREKIHGIYQS